MLVTVVCVASLIVRAQAHPLNHLSRTEGFLRDDGKKSVPVSADHDLLAAGKLELGSPKRLVRLQGTA